MDTDITDATDAHTISSSVPGNNASPASKGKSKAVGDTSMEEDNEEDEDEDDEDEDDEDIASDEEEEEDEDENGEKINPGVILGRRTRGVRVDYTSKEALAKAGLHGNEADEDEDEEMK